MPLSEPPNLLLTLLSQPMQQTTSSTGQVPIPPSLEGYASLKIAPLFPVEVKTAAANDVIWQMEEPASWLAYPGGFFREQIYNGIKYIPRLQEARYGSTSYLNRMKFNGSLGARAALITAGGNAGRSLFEMQTAFDIDRKSDAVAARRYAILFSASPFAASLLVGFLVGLTTAPKFGLIVWFLTLAIGILALNTAKNVQSSLRPRSLGAEPSR